MLRSESSKKQKSNVNQNVNQSQKSNVNQNKNSNLSSKIINLGPGSSAAGAVVVIVVVCVGLLLIIAGVVIFKLRGTGRRHRQRHGSTGGQMDWDDGPLNITVNPLDQTGAAEPVNILNIFARFF